MKLVICWSPSIVTEYATMQGIYIDGRETQNPYGHGSIYSTTEIFGSIGAKLLWPCKGLMMAMKPETHMNRARSTPLHKYLARLAGGEGVWVWEWQFYNSQHLEIASEVWEILYVFGFVAMEKGTTTQEKAWRLLKRWARASVATKFKYTSPSQVSKCLVSSPLFVLMCLGNSLSMWGGNKLICSVSKKWNGHEAYDIF